jgi:ABC-2 type transport system ATP-binding protein
VDNVCIIKNGKIAINGSPDEMKQSLLRHELILDAENRSQLIAELLGKGIFFKEEEHLIVPYHDRTAQNIIAQLNTPLTVLQVKQPTLEDAYIEYLNMEERKTA